MRRHIQTSTVGTITTSHDPELAVARAKRGREQSRSPPSSSSGGCNGSAGGITYGGRGVINVRTVGSNNGGVLSRELRQSLGLGEPSLVTTAMTTSSTSSSTRTAGSKKKSNNVTNGSGSTTPSSAATTPWDAEEDFRLLEEVMTHGPKWTLISRLHQPPRSVNVLKHRWALVEGLIVRAKDSTFSPSSPTTTAATAAKGSLLAQQIVPLKEILVDWHLQSENRSRGSTSTGKVIRSEVMQRVNLLTNPGASRAAAKACRPSGVAPDVGEVDSVGDISNGSTLGTATGTTTASTVASTTLSATVLPPPSHLSSSSSSGPRVIGSRLHQAATAVTTSPMARAMEEESNNPRQQLLRMNLPQSLDPSSSSFERATGCTEEVEKILTDIVSGDLSNILPPSSSSKEEMLHHHQAENSGALGEVPLPLALQLDDQSLLEMDCPVPTDELNVERTHPLAAKTTAAFPSSHGSATAAALATGDQNTATTSSSIEPLLSVLDEAENTSELHMNGGSFSSNDPVLEPATTRGQEEVEAVVARSVHELVEGNTLQTAGTLMGIRDPVSEEIASATAGIPHSLAEGDDLLNSAVNSAVISDTTTAGSSEMDHHRSADISYTSGVTNGSTAATANPPQAQTAFMAAWLNLQNSGMNFNNPVWSSVSEQTLQQQMMSSMASSSSSSAAASSASSSSSSSSSKPAGPGSSAPPTTVSPSTHTSSVAAASTAASSKSVKTLLPRLAACFPLPYLYSIGTQFSSYLPSAAILPLPSTIAINAAASPPFGGAGTSSNIRRSKKSLMREGSGNVASSVVQENSEDLCEADILLSNTLRQGQNSKDPAPIIDTLSSTKSIGKTFCPVAMFKTLTSFLSPSTFMSTSDSSDVSPSSS